MSPLVRKEIRLILPFCGIALVLAIFPAWFLGGGAFVFVVNEWVFWLFGFGLLLLGLAPFGQEFGLGTFSLMLAQPIERQRIWKTKILLVAGAAALVYLAFLVALHARFDLNTSMTAQHLAAGQSHRFLPNRNVFELQTLPPGNIVELQAQFQRDAVGAFWNAAKISLLLLAVTITSGFWTTLLFRQTGAAMWFAVLTPGILIVIVQGVCHGFPPHVQDIAVVTLLILYSLAGLLWARSMFASAQDSQWLGENVALLSLSPGKRRAEDTNAPRRKKAFRALLRKEFQSHQISFIVAFGLLVFHICALVVRGLYPLPRNSEARFVVEAVPFLWLLVPWLIGCVTVAEERKLGMMESQLCLPMPRLAQFAVKFTVALLLGVVLGGLMPCVIEGLGGLAGVSSEIVKSPFSPGSPIYFATVRETILAAAAIATVSFFASTLTRNTLHALGATIVLGLAIMAYFRWVIYDTNFYPPAVWAEPLLMTSLCVSIVTVLWLSFSNYKTLHVGGRIWMRNSLVLLLVLFLNKIGTVLFCTGVFGFRFI